MSRSFALSRIVLFVALVAAAIGWAAVPSAVAQDATPATGDCPTLSRDEKIAHARHWTEVAVSENNLDALDAYVAEDLVYDAGAFAPLTSRDDLKAVLADLLTAFPGAQFTVEHVVAEGDYVVVHWRGEGAHGGDFLGIPATGNTVSFPGINIYRFECGQIVEGWSEVDGIGLKAQLESEGAAPSTPVSIGDAAASPVVECETGTRDVNADIARQWNEVWSTQDASIFDEIAHPDINHRWAKGETTTGVEALKERMQAFFVAFPDQESTVELTIVDGDWVVVRWTATGTQTGQFFDLEPTGAEATWSGINLYRIECGQIVESWSEFDGLGLRAQLEQGAATPAP